MNGLTSGLNPDVVKTALDEVFYQNYYELPGPELATADTDAVFKQSSSDRASVITEVFKGVGLWGERAELEPIDQATPRVGDLITFTNINFAKSVDISKNFFDDEQHETVQHMMRDMAFKARITRNNKAMELYRNSFTTTLTADGVAWFSDTHTNLNGDTIDNLETAALSEASLNTSIIALLEQKGQDGVIAGHEPHCLLVPPALYKTAVEITESELRSDTANNDLNVYSYKYGIYVKQSQYLGAAAGGSDTAWFLLSNNHSAYRWIRQGIQTDLVDYRFTRNNVYVYKGEYREVYGAVTYEGAIGSDGTT